MDIINYSLNQQNKKAIEAIEFKFKAGDSATATAGQTALTSDFDAATLIVEIDGVVQDPSTYVADEATGEITFNTALTEGQVVTTVSDLEDPPVTEADMGTIADFAAALTGI